MSAPMPHRPALGKDTIGLGHLLLDEWQAWSGAGKR
jgi:hypothetical protein